MAAQPDVWSITVRERARYEEQFRGLNPVNGIVTGEQAKGFLLQSQLPPPILGLIWSLADRDADGKMDINEFSIACKLINLKLRGLDIPKVLPPSLLVMPSSTPPTLMSPGLLGQSGIKASPPAVPPPPKLAPAGGVPVLPTVPMVSSIASVSMSGVPAIPPLPIVMGSAPAMAPVPAMGTSVLPVSMGQPTGIMPSMMSSTSMIPGAQMAGAPILPSASMTAGEPMVPGGSTGSPVRSPPNANIDLSGAFPSPAMAGAASATVPVTIPGLPLAMAGEPKARSGSVVSIDSQMSLGSPLQEWAVPHQTKLRHTQVFNTNDRTRTGYLSGPQARNIMVQSRLSQSILAQIWALSDLDNDGRLTCEEFVLAMHLCEIAQKGEKIPPVLPADLIPPTFRRVRHGSIKTGGSGTPTGMQSGPGSVDGGDKDSPTSQDKRKQNFEKGQAELERRRKALLEIQRKEQEERERKEREEQEKKERIRLEQERRRQEEFERQLQRQKELEEEQEEQRRRAQEQREAARREMERQRQLEWEKQRSQELQQQRQKEQERVLQLKAQNQNLSIELSQRNEKVRELSQKISETRAAVSSVKAVIDGMRSTRDAQMAEMSALKVTLREQNQRLVALSQEKARLDAKNRTNPASGNAEDSDLVNQSFSNREILLKQLQDKINDQEKENQQKQQDIENNNTALNDLKDTLRQLVEKCEITYSEYENKRQQVCALRNVVNKDYNAQWGDSGGWPENQNSWDNTENAWPVDAPPVVAAPAAVPGMTRYRALFEFVARNSDELSFQPGDIIMVPNDHNAEPGWLAGELRGATGWFPESYVEPAEPTANEEISATAVAANDTSAASSQSADQDKRPLEGIVEVPENLSDNGSLGDVGGPTVVGEMDSPVLGIGQNLGNITARALYSWKGKKSSHLSFVKGDVITVQEQQELWSYGELRGQQGWFPNSYVFIGDYPSAEAGEYYMAMYPYQSAEPGDLTFEQGEVILVTKKDGDWWTGSIGGERTGMFPANYAQKVDSAAAVATKQLDQQPDTTVSAAPVVAAETQQVIEPMQEAKDVEQVDSQPAPPQETFKEKTESISTPDSVTSKSPLPQNHDLNNIAEDLSTLQDSKGKGKRPEIAQVLVPYQATSPEQLSLQRRQLVMVRKKTSTGWWEGELQAKGKKRQVGWFPASYVKLLTSSGTASGRTTPTAKFRDTPSPMFGKDRVIAMYSYEAQNSDELSFEKDEVITIVSREDPSWWKGELQGVTGLFPSNYVAAIPTDNSNFGGLSHSESKRQGYIQELIQTEQAYIEDMTTVHEAFEKPLLASNVISATDVQNIFVNWKEILQCNYMFLRALRVRRDMSPEGEIRMIGDILCENLPRMTAYARFCSCQLRAGALLQRYYENSPSFKQVLKKCQENPRTQGLPLGSFLIKPMQRITKYPLIISKILENTPVDHPDRQNLEEALAKAEEFCTQVNEGVREKENSDRLEWLQSHVNSDGLLEEPLTYNSLTNSLGPRKFLHHGLLTKANSRRELIAFLTNDFLLLASSNKPVGNHSFLFERNDNIQLKMYKKPFFLNAVTFSEGREPDVFRMNDGKRDYVLAAHSTLERNIWLRHLNDARTEFLDKENSMLQRQQSSYVNVINCYEQVSLMCHVIEQAQFGACGRILIVVVEGSDLITSPVNVRGRAAIGILRLVVIGGDSLDNNSTPVSGKCDAFCEVSMSSQKQRTPVVVGSSPRWNAPMQFLVKDLNEDVLCFTVLDQSYFAPNEFLGRSEVRIKDIPRDHNMQAGQYTLILKLREVKSGSITLKLDLRLFKNTHRLI